MDKIKGYRIAAGLTKEEAARALGISKVSYENKEAARFEFKKSELEALFKLLKPKIPKLQFEDLFF